MIVPPLSDQNLIHLSGYVIGMMTSGQLTQTTTTTRTTTHHRPVSKMAGKS